MFILIKNIESEDYVAGGFVSEVAKDEQDNFIENEAGFYETGLGLFKATDYEIEEYQDKPANITIVKEKSADEKIMDIRNAIKSGFTAIPKELRLAFAQDMTLIRQNLELGDYEVAYDLADAIDLGAVDPQLLAVATATKASVVGEIQQIKVLKGLE